MGILRSLVTYVATEVVNTRFDLVKAGLLTPTTNVYEPKASLVDPFGFHSLTAFGFKEKYSILDYSKLRQISFADPIVAAIIQTRLNQVASFALPQTDRFKTGYKIVLRDREKEPTKAERNRCREFQEFILNCGIPETFEETPERKKREKLSTFLRKVVRDSLVYDQINFEITPRRNGLPYSFHAVDAATIRLIPDKKEQMEAFHSPNVNEMLKPDFESMMPFPIYHPSRNEYRAKHPRYVQVVNGIVRHSFDEWEMAFGIRNPRTDLLSYGYGFSELEMLVTIVTAHMNAEAYNRKFFTQGSGVKGVMAFEGQVPRDQLEAFRRQWHQQVSGVNNFWKTPIMSMGNDTKMHWIDLQKTNREMEYGKWLEYCIKTICFIPDTLVIMEDGLYKRIDNIEAGDKVITHMGRSQVVKNTQVSMYDDDLICLKIGSGGGVVKATKDHPFYIVSSENTSWMAKDFDDPKWVKAKDIIAGRDYFVVPKRKFKDNNFVEEIDFENHLIGVDYTKNDNDELKLNTNRSSIIPSKLPLNENTGYVLGLYAAEGSSFIGGNLSWSFHIKEEKYKEAVSDFIIDYLHLKPQFAQIGKGNCVQVRVGGKLVTSSFQSLFGRYSYKRYVPNEILNASEEVQKAFLSGVIAGDGSVWENNTNSVVVSIATSSEIFAHQLKSMFLSYGIWSGIYISNKAKAFEKYDCKTMYDVRIQGRYASLISEWLIGEKGDKLRDIICDRSFTSTVYETPANFYVSVSEIWEEHYKGEVFNMEVDVDNSYLVEQCAVHNCGVYNIDPIEIGFDISRIGSGDKGSGGGLSDGSPVERIVQSQDKGLKPLLRFIANLLNEYILYRIDPDFEFEFVGLNANSEKEELDLDQKKTQTYTTIDETRHHHDMPSLKPFDQIDSIGDLILDPNIISAFAQKKQSEYQQIASAEEQDQEMEVMEVEQEHEKDVLGEEQKHEKEVATKQATIAAKNNSGNNDGNGKSDTSKSQLSLRL